MLEPINSNPLVSCIIIFFNAKNKKEKFFEEAIESVFTQTYYNWELLLVDDGSTDESTAIALRYAQQYPEKVRYLEHEGHQNRGMSATRNLGILHAKGDYIALLDADDVWLPQKLEQQVAILEAQPEAGMVYGSTLTWYSWTDYPKDVKYDPRDPKRDYGRVLGVKPDRLVLPPTLIKLFLKGKAVVPVPTGVLIRRELVKKVGGFEESFRGMFEDQAFFYKVCLNSPVFVASDCWDKYRQHSNNCCHVAEALGQYDPYKPNSAHLTFLTWLETYLSQQAMRDADIWRLLNKALRPYKHKKLYSLLQPYFQMKRSVNRRARQLLKPILIARNTNLI